MQERNPRVDPFARTVIFERIDETGVSRIYSTRVRSSPAARLPGPQLPGTPYLVGGDATPVPRPTALRVAFTRLTGIGNGGLGTWDLLTLRADGVSTPVVIATGPALPGRPRLGLQGDPVRGDRRRDLPVAARARAARRIGAHRAPHRGREQPHGAPPAGSPAASPGTGS